MCFLIGGLTPPPQALDDQKVAPPIVRDRPKILRKRRIVRRFHENLRGRSDPTPKRRHRTGLRTTNRRGEESPLSTRQTQTFVRLRTRAGHSHGDHDNHDDKVAPEHGEFERWRKRDDENVLGQRVGQIEEDWREEVEVVGSRSFATVQLRNM